MKITVDPKSALCGLALGVVAMLLIGAATSSNPVGKYRAVTGVSDGKGYAIIIDTQTGQAWCNDGAFQLSKVPMAGFWTEK